MVPQKYSHNLSNNIISVQFVWFYYINDLEFTNCNSIGLLIGFRYLLESLPATEKCIISANVNRQLVSTIAAIA